MSARLTAPPGLGYTEADLGACAHGGRRRDGTRRSATRHRRFAYLDDWRSDYKIHSVRSSLHAPASRASTRRSCPTACSSCSSRRRSGGCSPSTGATRRRTRSAATASPSTGRGGARRVVLEVELRRPRAPRPPCIPTRRPSRRATREAYVDMKFEPLYFGVTTLEEAAPDLDWRFHDGPPQRDLRRACRRRTSTGSWWSEPSPRGPPASAPGLLARLAQAGARPALTFYRGKRSTGGSSYAELCGAGRGARAARCSGVHGLRRAIASRSSRPTASRFPCWSLRSCDSARSSSRSTLASARGLGVHPGALSGARALCATRELAERVASRSRPEFTLASKRSLAGRRRPRAPRRRARDLSEPLAVVLYTSGTTGNPKGVALRQRSLLANALEHGRELRDRGTTQLAVLPLYHAHAFGFGLMTALVDGRAPGLHRAARALHVGRRRAAPRRSR